jgi:formamidopyrimidine-DNA glycosylase
MPELPEVETVRRGLEPVMAGARIESVKLARDGLRFPFPVDFAGQLAGQTVTVLARRAKYLLFHLDGGAVIISHLGMSGSYRVEDKAIADGAFHHERGKDARHDHVRFDLITTDGHSAALVYNDPRRFGFMLLAEGPTLDQHPLLCNLGEEPLSNVLGGERLQELFAGKKAPLKAALLDQRLVAGLGNIYVCEALHRSRLSPERPAGSLSRKGRPAREEADRLASAIREVIAEAIAAGGSSLRDYVHTDGTLGYFQHRFAVYDREGDPCLTPACGGTVERIVQSGRSTFFCRRCQR